MLSKKIFLKRVLISGMIMLPVTSCGLTKVYAKDRVVEPEIKQSESVVDSKGKNNELDDYIYGLNYDPLKILSFQGETIKTTPPTETDWREGKFYVIEKKKSSMTDGSADISVLSNNEGCLYPGSILLANRDLAEGRPTAVSANRRGVTLSIDLPGMTEKDNQETVKKPNYGNVNGAVQTLIERWIKNYPEYKEVPSKVEFQQSEAYSMSQLKTQFGLGFEQAAQKLNVNFEAISNGESRCIVLKFKQIYFTVNADLKTSPGQYFGNNVTASDLERRGVNQSSPPAYVSNVSYGRTVYAAVETNSNSDKFKLAVQAVIKGQDISSDVELKQIVENSTFKAVAYGGGAGSASKVVQGNLDSIKEIIDEGKYFTRDTPAVPISFGTVFLKDNAQAVTKNTTDYIETTVKEFSGGAINLVHSGWYVARYYINWDEISYDGNGQEVLTPKSWIENDQDKTMGFSTTIPLPANARNIQVKIKECTGLAWDWWKVVYDKNNLPLTNNRTITIWGTTLVPDCDDSST